MPATRGDAPWLLTNESAVLTVGVGAADGIFADPDLTMFTRLDELGLVVVEVRRAPDRAVLACRVVAPDGWCRRC